MNSFKDYSAAFYKTNIDVIHYGVKGMHWGVRNQSQYIPHPRKKKLNTNDVSLNNKKKSNYETDKAKIAKIKKGVKIASNVARLAALGAPIAGAILQYKSAGVPIKSMINRESMKMLATQVGVNYVRSAPRKIAGLGASIVAEKAFDKAVDYGLRKKYNKKRRNRK